MKDSIITSKEEFEIMFKEYIIPLLGISNNNSQYKKHKMEKNELVVLKQQQLYFYDSVDSDKCFIVQVSKNFPKSNLNLLRTVYAEMMKVRHKNYDESIKNEYDSLQHLKKNYEYQLQKSLLNWFAGNNTNLLELIDKLESWKEKTYEGKKVPFAFLIDENSRDGEFPFMDFLEEEYSATFSDGITSIIELDANLKFLTLKSITDKAVDVVYNLDNVPYRFSQIIETFTRDKLAVFY